MFVICLSVCGKKLIGVCVRSMSVCVCIRYMNVCVKHECACKTCECVCKTAISMNKNSTSYLLRKSFKWEKLLICKITGKEAIFMLSVSYKVDLEMNIRTFSST